MRLSEFLRDRITSILLNIVCSVLLVGFLMTLGNQAEILFLILAFWYSILIVFYITQYIIRKKYYDELLDIAKGLEQKYLISEIIEHPRYFDSLTYYTLLKMANKSMIEETTRIKNERKAYKEYIEQWVHEIKTPIASIKLTGENNKSDVTREVLSELDKIDHYVEQALFYARSENVEKDYLIKEVPLKTCVNAAIIKNKRMFIQNNIAIELFDLEKLVYADSKWIEFIINQLLMNAVKYRCNTSPKIKIYTQDIRNGVSLIIEDNGIGIEESEIARVFEKGFTGNNGRNNDEKATGLGLYLCKRLCDKLGLGIIITSKQHAYTKVSLVFPKGSLVKI